jgi:DNA-binding XRE family transcriptional regulator
MNERIERLMTIKKNTGMSQENMAREIGVSLHTVNRWFKGKFSPMTHLEYKIDDFIKKHS